MEAINVPKSDRFSWSDPYVKCWTRDRLQARGAMPYAVDWRSFDPANFANATTSPDFTLSALLPRTLCAAAHQHKGEHAEPSLERALPATRS